MAVFKLLLSLLVFGILTLSSVLSVDAQEQLSNGAFETITESPGWTITESITGMPGLNVDAAAIVDFANQPSAIPGENGLWLRSFEGNSGDYLGNNFPINARLEQTTPATPGEVYTFSGWSNFQLNYSGGIAFMDPTSPSGAIPSPTDTRFNIEFIDGSGAVIGPPTTLDLRTEQFNGFGWIQHTLNALAPAGTVDVRVSANATNMLFNVDPDQSALVDNFSLKANSAPGVELLTNADLNMLNTAADWNFSAPAGGEENNIQLASFANYTAGGALGVWLKAFLGGNASFSQTVPGAPGLDYTFSAYSLWESDYSGGLLGTGTDTVLELAFLDDGNSVIGAPIMLDLRNEQTNDSTWRQHSLMASSPAGTASVRVAGIATGMVSTTGAQSAFFDDFSLMVTALPEIPGDANGDGNVDLLDLDILGSNFGTIGDATFADGDFNGDGNVDLLDLDILGSNFGFVSAPSTKIPEPTALALVYLCLSGLILQTRRGN